MKAKVSPAVAAVVVIIVVVIVVVAILQFTKGKKTEAPKSPDQGKMLTPKGGPQGPTGQGGPTGGLTPGGGPQGPGK
jgi:cell division protein FtsN